MAPQWRRVLPVRPKKFEGHGTDGHGSEVRGTEGEAPHGDAAVLIANAETGGLTPQQVLEAAGEVELGPIPSSSAPPGSDRMQSLVEKLCNT